MGGVGLGIEAYFDAYEGNMGPGPNVTAGSSDLSVAGAQEDFTAVESLRPDVMLAAVEPEDLSPARAIVVLSSGTPEWTQEMLRAGVRAVLPVNATPPEILAAIFAAAADLAAIDPEELDGLLAPAARTASAAPQPLTARELDVLRMMAEGAANKTIAWKLDISEHTVKFHVASIMTKLDAGSRTEAVTTGIRHGLILICHPSGCLRGWGKAQIPVRPTIVPVRPANLKHSKLTVSFPVAELWNLRVSRSAMRSVMT